MRTVAGWVGLLALVGLVGCASDDAVPAPPPEQTGLRLDLPTSDWKAGDDMMFARISGVVRVDAQGCVFLRSKEIGVPPTRLRTVWPKGFTAYRHDDEVTLYGPEGEVIAVEGDTIESGGGEVPVDESLPPSECLTPSGKVWAIQGDVRVVSD